MTYPRDPVPTRRALWVSTSLASRGGICTYVRNARETPLWRNWNIRHVATHVDGGIATRILAYAIGVAKFISELVFHRPDIVHIHTASSGSFVRKSLLTWLSAAAGIPVVLHIHGGGFKSFFERSPHVGQRFIRATLERAAAVAALGTAWANDLQSIAPAANVVVVPNAIRLRSPVQQAEATQVNFVFLGKVCDGKGAFVLIDAWAKLIKTLGQSAPITLTIAGDGEVDRARTRVIALSLGDSCDVPGWVPGPAVDDLLVGAHVLVLPSMAEGQPMAILEAMARGLTVIASDVGGIPEMLSDGVGVLVEPGNADALAEEMAAVIRDPHARARYGALGRHRIESQFDIDSASARFDKVYCDILMKGSRSS